MNAVSFQLKSDIADRLDCREVYEQLTGQIGRGSLWRTYQPPHEHQRTPSFSVGPHGYHDHSDPDVHGDVFSLIALVEGLDVRLQFTDVLAIAAGLAGVVLPHVETRLPAYRPLAGRLSKPEMPQIEPALWQREATRLIADCEQRLWSPSGAQALAYLRTTRGLSDETIRAAHLGFNPAWAETAIPQERHGKPGTASLAPGIIIPWYAIDGRVEAIRIRRIVGNLAEAFGATVQPAYDSKKSPKYSGLTGSKPNLYRASLIPGAPVVLCEGEFDARLGAQHLSDYNVWTLGSATASLEALAELQDAPYVVFLLDNDAAGNDGTIRLLTALDARIPALVTDIPSGKDVTDFVCDGGDLPALVAAADRPKGELALAVLGWPSVLPAQLERAFMMYFHDLGTSAAIFTRAVLLAVKDGIDPQQLTLRDIQCSPSVAEAGVSYKTLWKGARSAEKIVISISHHFPEQEKDSISLADTPIVPNGNNSPEGRRREVFSLKRYVDVAKLLIDEVIAWRIVEKHFKDLPDKTPVTARLLEAVGVEADPEDVKRALTETGIVCADDAVQKEVRGRAVVECKRWIWELKNMAPAPIPTGMTWGRSSDYKAMVARRQAEMRADAPVSLKQAAQETGLDRKALMSAQRRAGVVRERHYVDVPLADVPLTTEGVPKQWSADGKGYARTLIMVQEDGIERTISLPEARPAAVRATIAESRRMGAVAVVRYQTASTQRLLTPDERIAREAELEVRQSKPLDLHEVSARPAEPKPEPYTGLGHDPRYARRWLLSVLMKLGFTCYEQGIDALQHAQTGEVIEGVQQWLNTLVTWNAEQGAGRPDVPASTAPDLRVFIIETNARLAGGESDPRL